MVRPALLCCLLMQSTFACAQGCGPTRLKVSESIVLDMPPAKAWAVVGNFQDLSWDEATVATKGTGGNEPDKALRAVTLQGGAIFEESLYKYDADAMSYSYHIDTIDVGRLPVQNVSATIEIVPEGGKSLVRWRSAFYRYLAPGEPAPEIADANATRAMAAYLTQSLRGLVKKADAKT